MSIEHSHDALPFATPITVTGPQREPVQMLQEQSFDGHASVHDQATADSVGLVAPPIEAPTHFSQFDPLAYALWGNQWFETGCISAHFRNMVTEGESVTATLSSTAPGAATIHAEKPDGTSVLVGSASVDPEASSALDERLAALGDPGELFIVDRLQVGQRSSETISAEVDMDSGNGHFYPFSLRQKLAAITEPCSWYESGDNPWGRPILPMEMVSVLSQKSGADLAVRGPALGLFLDLEVKLVHGPIFVGQQYRIDRQVLGLSQSRRTESYWVRSTLTDPDTGDVAATVTLHSGVFKQSYAGYPADRL